MHTLLCSNTYMFTYTEHMNIPFLVNLAKSRCLGHLCLLSQTAAISLSAHSRLLLTQKSSSSLTISSCGARDFAGHLARAEPQSRCLCKETKPFPLHCIPKSKVFSGPRAACVCKPEARGDQPAEPALTITLQGTDAGPSCHLPEDP